jgi:hypothetical protein
MRSWIVLLAFLAAAGCTADGDHDHHPGHNNWYGAREAGSTALDGLLDGGD